jgi:hypothetical protein
MAVVVLLYPDGLPVALFPKFLMTPITDNLSTDQTTEAVHRNSNLIAYLGVAYPIRKVIDKYHKYLGLPVGLDALSECDANVFTWGPERQVLYADAICRAMARDPAMEDKIMDQLSDLEFVQELAGSNCVSLGNLAYLSKHAVQEEVRSTATKLLAQLSVPRRNDDLWFIN